MQWIKRLGAELFLAEEMVAPRLVAEVDYELEIGGIADAANHSNQLMC
jgi:hypothetical protein